MNLFEIWNQLKQKIDQKENISFVNDREICFVNLGKNVGHEQDGKNKKFERPVVVLKKFGQQTFFGLPLTSKPKNGPFYFTFDFQGNTSFVILSQIRLFDTKRIERKLGYMNKEDFSIMKSRLRQLLAL